MNRIVLLLSFCLSFLLVSCTIDIFAPGYISVDGEKRLDLQCGYEADMSGIGFSILQRTANEEKFVLTQLHKSYRKSHFS